MNIALSQSFRPSIAMVGARDILFAVAWVVASGWLLLASPSLAVPGKAGTVDATWGETVDYGFGRGKVVVPPFRLTDEAFDGRTGPFGSIAVQSDRKLVALTRCRPQVVNSLRDKSCVARLNPDGSIDESFNGTGVVYTSIISGLGGVEEFFKLHIQNDGKILITGSCVSVGNEFCMIRFNENGTLDRTFNGTGYVRVLAGRTSYGGTSTLLSDGRILIGGVCDYSATSGFLDYRFCVARYLADGTLDTSFNKTGIATLTAVGRSALRWEANYVNAIIVGNAGDVTAYGSCSYPPPGPPGVTTYSSCHARWDAQGAVDLNYGADGLLRFERDGPPIGGKYVMQSTGQILVRAGCSEAAVCVYRLNPNGSVDNTFGQSGKILFNANSARQRGDLLLRPDDRFIVTATCVLPGSTTEQACLYRFNPNGDLDATFGNLGVANNVFFNENVLAVTLAAQADGRVFSASNCSFSGATCVTRFDTDCSLDYDGSGTLSASTDATLALRIMLGISGNELIRDITFALRSTRTSSAEIIAYKQYCSASTVCNGDIDGDRRQLATTDGLIITRAMLGITGDRILNGINLPANATRRTWPDIRNHLVQTCGVVLP